MYTSSAQVAQIEEWTENLQSDIDATALKSENYMNQFLGTTGTTFFDWVNQEMEFNGYIVLVNRFKLQNRNCEQDIILFIETFYPNPV